MAGQTAAQKKKAAEAKAAAEAKEAEEKAAAEAKAAEEKQAEQDKADSEADEQESGTPVDPAPVEVSPAQPEGDRVTFFGKPYERTLEGGYRRVKE